MIVCPFSVVLPRNSFLGVAVLLLYDFLFAIDRIFTKESHQSKHI